MPGLRVRVRVRVRVRDRVRVRVRVRGTGCVGWADTERGESAVGTGWARGAAQRERGAAVP